MKKIHQNQADAQRPCFADFRAPIVLEDGRRYVAGVTVSTNRDGETQLRLYLRPPPTLTKTPVTPGRVEVVVR